MIMYRRVEVKIQHSSPYQEMTVSHQFHDPAALPMGKEIPIPTACGCVSHTDKLAGYLKYFINCEF
jgi:hypothetical protein